ncbi:MAG TPA: Hsp33 family molecular chaperone HslO [Burkholderiales bacterium]|nr:Hsp33 family molecular chaperone HslO [Burkholderiales bacterium]
MKTDSLQRFLFENFPIRGGRVHLDASLRTIFENHDYPPVLRIIMGELCSAAVLLAATLKLEGSLVLQIQGRGAIRLLVVECGGDLALRATAKWEGELEGGSLPDLVGEGRFVITLDQKGGQAYQGIVALEGESVAEILQNYMIRSEQLETRLWLSSEGGSASGLLLQKLPEGASADEDAWNRVTHLASTVSSEELMNLSTEKLLHRLYHEEDLRLFDSEPVFFRCTCSREKVAGMLRMLGKEEVESVIEERQTVEVHCEFCNRRYEFDRVDAAQLFSPVVPAAASTRRH